MKIKKHRLLNDDGTVVPFQDTPNKSGTLKGNKPKFIVIHFTANGTAVGALRWLSNPAAKASAHLVIGHDGDVTQMVKFNERAFHAGKSKWKGFKGLNSHSVGIEIVNWGGLTGDWGGWRSWTGAAVPDDRVIEAAHRNHPGDIRGWEIYDEAQIEAAAEAVSILAETYGLGPKEVIGHEDISPSRKTDPGPAWDMERFRARVFGREEEDEEDDLFKVASNSGLNLRKGAGIDHDVIELLPDGTAVMVVERHGLWWMVAKMKGDAPDTTGWVHSNWLVEV